MVFLDKPGWPVELVKGHRVQNAIRLILKTRRFKRGMIEQWNAQREAVKGFKRPRR